MSRRVVPFVLAAILAVGILAPPAAAQPADYGLALFLETYRVVRDESLFGPSTEALLKGAEAGLQRLLREEGLGPASLPALVLTGDERADLETFVHRLEQVQGMLRLRPLAVVHAAVGAMVAALRDPNSAFYPPEAFTQFVRRTRGDEFVGVGIVIEDRAGQTVITEVLENSPAGEAGLRAGDVIVAVDGTPVAGLSLEQVSQLIRGAEGTQVVLTIRRGEEPPLAFTIARRRIVQRIVTWRLLPSGVGYLRVTQFTQAAADQVATALRTLVQEGARGIVLDLRGNPGGLLEASVNIASHFLDRGVVVTLDSGRGQQTPYLVRPREPKYGGPLVVLVDRGSASASEVVAGALQDAGVKLVGTRTYGKATVQAVYRFRDGSGLRLTISRYLTPSGRDIEGQGLLPDIEMAASGGPIGSADDAQLNRAVALVQQAAGEPSRFAVPQSRPAPAAPRDPAVAVGF
ncbi:MAG: S41 family peptidase [Armatimonadota bacterium]|nr:S41 family peptidase [Armatimonadota bacterium]MDR7485734.1 S41 family peptidase [Armatimonadota bacterium]MDR7534149.1 S41 family peptidase [Armatimonadota bacterium]MDR7536398.1 S41 family peptidase [Armatimonadota bacterium]